MLQMEGDTLATPSRCVCVCVRACACACLKKITIQFCLSYYMY